MKAAPTISAQGAAFFGPTITCIPAGVRANCSTQRLPSPSDPRFMN